MPLTVVCILLLLSVLIRNVRWKKRLFWFGFGLLLFLSNYFIANQAMRWWEVKTLSYQEMKPYKLGIVLTGSTIPFLKPDDRVYFGRGADRVTHTVQLYKLGLIEKVLISGGSGRLTGDDEPEANKFRKAMVLMGIDSVDIFIENETRNTYESAVAVKPMLDSLQYNPQDCLLITSAFHMRRSLACYKKAGVALTPFSTDFYAHQNKYYPADFFIPKLEAIGIWEKLIREWVGLLAYNLVGYA